MSKLLVDEISDADNTGPVTVTDGLTVQGAFTSLGIDDNATSTIITIDETGDVGIGVSSSFSNEARVQIAVATSDPNAGSPTNSSALLIKGGTTTVGNGPVIALSNISGVKETIARITAETVSGNNGDLTFSIYNGGGTIPETIRFQAGGGISFNGDTAAANALDDYEEGVWYPAAASGMTTAAGTPTYSGTYTKVGNIVNVYFRQNGGTLNLSHTGYATGLPFEPSNTLAYVGSATNSGPTIVGICMPWAGGALYFHLDAAYNSQTDFIMSVSYRTA